MVTMPISDASIIVGKYLAGLAVLVAAGLVGEPAWTLTVSTAAPTTYDELLRVTAGEAAEVGDQPA